MPITTNACAEASGSSIATFAPNPAPTASEGAKMPPGMPLIDDAAVASSFRRPNVAGMPPSPCTNARACAYPVPNAVPPDSNPHTATTRPHKAANATRWRMTNRPRRPGMLPPNRIRTRLNPPPSRPPSTPSNGTANQPATLPSAAWLVPK